MARIMKAAFPESDSPILIAVGGPGGTGKTTFAGRLAGELGDAAILSLDDYKTSRSQRRHANIFGPHPSANRMDMIVRHLDCLRSGQKIDKPVYNRTTGNADSTEPFVPANWIIVEGEVATYAEFRDLVDFSIFIDSDWQTQLATRLGRDLAGRDYTPDKAIATFLHSNLREFVEHGAHSKQWADVHLFCNDRYRLRVESIDQSVYDKYRDIWMSEISPVEMEGLLIPLLTPFAESGSIDEKAFVEHIDWLAQAGARRIIIGDALGEFFSLATDERLLLIELALEYFPGLIWAQVGGGPIPDAVHLAKEAKQLGADGLICLPPIGCAHSTIEGVLRYFDAVKAGTEDIPVMLANPSNPTHPALTTEAELSIKHAGIITSSDASEQPAHFRQTNRPGKRDSCFVSSFANVWPELYVEIEQAILKGDANPFEEITSRIDDEIQGLGGSHPKSLKKLLASRLPEYPGQVRPPLG